MIGVPWPGRDEIGLTARPECGRGGGGAASASGINLEHHLSATKISHSLGPGIFTEGHLYPLFPEFIRASASGVSGIM